MNKQSTVNESVPLTNRDDVHRLQRELLANGDFDAKRNYVLFNLAVYTAMPIDELLDLRVVEAQRKTLAVEIAPNRFVGRGLNERMARELDDYIRDFNLKGADLLFAYSRNLDVRLTPKQVSDIIHYAGNSCGLSNLGLDTLRKTFGRIWFEEGRDVDLIRRYYRKGSVREMLEYIGADPDTDLYAKALENFNPRDDRDIYDVVA